MTTNLLYTSIPDPTYSGPGLRLTVVISPRLEPAGTLADFPELADLPQLVSTMQLQVELAGQIYPAVIAPPRRPIESRDSVLYGQIFPSSCPVNAWAFTAEDTRPLRVFPATAIDARIHQLYGAIARQGTNTPRVLDVGALICSPETPLCSAPHFVPNEFDRAILDFEAATEALNLTDAQAALLPAAVRNVREALRFYARGPADTSPVMNAPFDAHARASLLGDHPTLNRKLGFVFDVLVFGADILSIPQQDLVRVRPQWRGSNSTLDLCPYTYYDTSSGAFRASTVNNQELENGYLRLDRPEYRVLQVDGDGATFALSSVVPSIRKSVSDPHSPPKNDQYLPALRSSGLRIVRTDRGGPLSARLGAQANMNAVDPNQLVFGDSDLLRGFRVDVEVAGTWHSLLRRCGRIYDPQGALLFELPEDQDEEGYVKAASATSVPGAPDLYVHEAFVKWAGWSLGARMPGETIAYDPNTRHDVLAGNENAPGTSPVSAEYRVTPATLPKLRYGQTYRMRARAVSLSGDSSSLGDPNSAYATPPVTFLRYEPVPAPFIAQWRRIIEAESLENMPVRSDPHATTRPSWALDENRRHLIAPKASLETVERHGRLDPYLVSGANANERWRIAIRERGTMVEGYIEGLTQQDQVTDRQLINFDGENIPWPEIRGAPPSEGEYVICTEDQVRCPWLTEPMSIGAAIWEDVAGAPVELRHFQPRADAPASAPWLEPDSLLIVLYAVAAGQPRRIRPGAVTDRELHIELPPGDRMTLKYASIPHQQGLESMAMWTLLTAADRALLEQDIRDGRHWMFSPARTLTCVNACSSPVTAPLFAAPITVTRAIGESRATIDTQIASHGHSTSHVDVRASWSELDDSGATPQLREVKTDAFRTAIDYDEVITPTAVTRVISERRPVIVQDAGECLQITELVTVDPAKQDFPDSKCRAVRYTPVGTTRWQEYLPPEVIADVANLQLAGPTEQVIVPSSARPLPPVVSSVLPTFRRTGSGLSRQHLSNAIRIYLDRPWFSSGAGEALAILIAPSPGQPPPGWESRVSRWAQDAVWSRPAPAALGASSFVIPLNETVDDGQGLGPVPRVQLVAGIGNEPIDAIVVVPEYSAERKMWFCDIEFTGASYFPFVSLALARYQANALAHCFLSEVVRAELVQLAPDRSASVTVTGRTARVVVRGVSAGNRAEAQGNLPPSNVRPRSGTPGGAHRMRAYLEQPATPGNELDWTRPRPVELVGAWSGDLIEWTGSLTIPRTGAWRVVIEESEFYATENHLYPDVLHGERVTYVEILST